MAAQPELRARDRKLDIFFTLHFGSPCPDISHFLTWIKLCSDLLTKWLSGSLATGYKENEICWCCSDFVTHLEASSDRPTQTLLELSAFYKYRAITLTGSPAIQHSAVWNAMTGVSCSWWSWSLGQQCLIIMSDSAHSPTLATLPNPILWSCLLIMHNSETVDNEKRLLFLYLSILQFTLFQGLQQTWASNLTKTTEIRNQTTSCVSAKPSKC